MFAGAAAQPVGGEPGAGAAVPVRGAADDVPGPAALDSRVLRAGSHRPGLDQPAGGTQPGLAGVDRADVQRQRTLERRAVGQVEPGAADGSGVEQAVLAGEAAVGRGLSSTVSRAVGIWRSQALAASRPNVRTVVAYRSSGSTTRSRSRPATATLPAAGRVASRGPPEAGTTCRTPLRCGPRG